ncbi:MAG: class I SAM-dependent methyltransferase [Alphaproteobacteria bacterium]|nr:class I SAM-dependent methyltransferase [Alphaproteobacteria bacterium]
MNELPPYMQVLYDYIYGNRMVSGILDDSRVNAVTTFGASGKIINDVLHDVTKNAHVLQIGLTFGKEISAVYEKVKKHGKLDVFDVSEMQIEMAKDKYLDDDICITNYNASMPWDEKYDVVICYNLISELPPKTRQAVMDNVLNSLTNGGKAVFVDCAKPEMWNPLKYPLLWYNRLYRPFAESLWNQPIESFATQKDEFRWHHTYYRGHMYQKTVAVRKILSGEDVLKLTKIFRGK